MASGSPGKKVKGSKPEDAQVGISFFFLFWLQFYRGPDSHTHAYAHKHAHAHTALVLSGRKYSSRRNWLVFALWCEVFILETELASSLSPIKRTVWHLSGINRL